MEQHSNIQQLLARVLQLTGRPVVFNEAQIHQEYAQEKAHQSVTAIKILSVIGGFLATLAFLGFLFLGGIYDSGSLMIVLGLVFIIGAIGLNFAFDNLIIGTFSVTTFISGFILVAIGCIMQDMDENTVVYLLMALTVISLFFTQNYILTFVSTLAISGYILALYIINDKQEYVFLHINILTLLIAYVFFQEGFILSLGKKWSKLYRPLRAALVFSLFSILFANNYRYLSEANLYGPWVSSIIPIIVILYLVYILLKLTPDRSSVLKIIIGATCLLILIPTSFAPGILCSLLILLLSFYVNYKTGLVLSIVAFIYFTSVFYYDLQITLLVKSLLLFFSGVLFIVLYLLTNRKLKAHDEI